MELNKVKGCKRDVCEQLFDAILNGKDTVTIEVLFENELKRVSFVVPKITGTLMQRRTYAKLKANEMYYSVSEFA